MMEGREMSPGKTALLLAIALVFLTGTQCTVNGSTGGGGRGSGAEAAAATESSSGRLAGCSSNCVRFTAGSKRKSTGADGRFTYSSGTRIRFFVGDLPLGDEVDPKDPMTPADLIEGGSVESPAVVNLARLLMSFDSTPEEASISIPENVHRKLVLSNEEVAHWIRAMRFEDEAQFLNAASQFLAVCANDYPFTPSLVTKDQAKRWLLSLR